MSSSFQPGVRKLPSWQITWFMIRLLLLLCLWLLIKYLTGPEEALAAERNFPSIAPTWIQFQNIIREILLWVNKVLLQLMGYEGVYIDRYLVTVAGYGGVVVGDACLAIDMMALYSSLVLATNARLKNKVAGVIAGIAGIQVINVTRIMAVNLMTIYYPEYANMAHHYIFNTVVFVAILLMFNFFLHHNYKN